MGIPCDDVVVIQEGKDPGQPSMITVSCPDKAGLACDLCRIILEFGLFITHGDFSTDGRWCYILLWVIPHPVPTQVDWESLKNRLFSVCPSCLFSYYFSKQTCGSSAPMYLLKVFCLDRKGLLHDVTSVLCKLELTIQRVKVMTTPDDRVLDLFCITDGMDLLHTKARRDDTCEQVISVLGEYCISCELQLAGPEYESQQGFSSLSPEVANELFTSDLSKNDAYSKDFGPDASNSKKTIISVDNLLSPSHTLLRIQCATQKGLFYDISRIAKDCNIQIAHARVFPSIKGLRNIDLLVQQTDGTKIVNPANQIALCSRLKEEILHPLRMVITNKGPDTELLVANPVELCGKGRPRVFYDVTYALKTLGICIFSAEIGRHSTSDREWEVYKFLLEESRDFPLSIIRSRKKILDTVRGTLMGW